MQKFKKAITIIPEYYLLALVIFYWISTSLFNPIAIGLFAIMVFQIITKNSYTGIIIGVLFFLITLYMHFALLDEVHDFPSFNAAARRMFYTGILIFSPALVMSILMLNKYTSPSTERGLEIKAES